MKWYQSIFSKITFIFFFAFLGLVVFGSASVMHQIEEQEDNLEDFAKAVLRNAYQPQTHRLDLEILEQDGFNRVTDMNFLLSYADDDFLDDRPKKGRPFKLDIIEYKGSFYLLTKHFRSPEVFIFTTPKEPASPIFVLFFGVLGVALFILYVLTIKSIFPLLSLKKSVIALGDGELNPPKMSKNKDEIAALTNALHESITKIKHLRESRALFLRNIMHELKTPITKGRLALAMIEENSYKDKLESLFERQEVLLEEFSRIEKLSAKELKLDLKPYHIDDIFAQVFDLMPKEEPDIELKSEDLTLRVDYNLFCVALKNLLDNALNYSEDAKAYLSASKSQITIKNRGIPLNYPLKNYSEAYFLGSKKSRESRGLGFGLYIALEVFRLHNVPCEYLHVDGCSIFRLDIKSIV